MRLTWFNVHKNFAGLPIAPRLIPSLSAELNRYLLNSKTGRKILESYESLDVSTQRLFADEIELQYITHEQNVSKTVRVVGTALMAGYVFGTREFETAMFVQTLEWAKGMHTLYTYPWEGHSDDCAVAARLSQSVDILLECRTVDAPVIELVVPSLKGEEPLAQGVIEMNVAAVVDNNTHDLVIEANQPPVDQTPKEVPSPPAKTFRSDSLISEERPDREEEETCETTGGRTKATTVVVIDQGQFQKAALMFLRQLFSNWMVTNNKGNHYDKFIKPVYIKACMETLESLNGWLSLEYFLNAIYNIDKENLDETALSWIMVSIPPAVLQVKQTDSLSSAILDVLLIINELRYTNPLPAVAYVPPMQVETNQHQHV